MAPSLTASPDSLLRLVTRVKHCGAAGMSCLTCSEDDALSTRMSTLRPSKRDRYSDALSSSVSGMFSGGMSRARKKESSAWVGATAGPGPNPHMSMYRLPSGNRCRAWCAQWRASAVLPTPGGPDTADTGAVIDAPLARTEVRRSSSRIAECRLTNLDGPAGSWLGDGNERPCRWSLIPPYTVPACSTVTASPEKSFETVSGCRTAPPFVSRYSSSAPDPDITHRMRANAIRGTPLVTPSTGQPRQEVNGTAGRASHPRSRLTFPSWLRAARRSPARVGSPPRGGR